MFVCLDLKFHKELKLLFYLRELLEKPFQYFYYSLKKLFEEKEFQNTILLLFKSYANNICKGNILQMVYIK
jgi:hypothetical protein